MCCSMRNLSTVHNTGPYLLLCGNTSGALRTGMQLLAFLLCVYTPLFTLWAAYVNELLPLPVCSHTKVYVRAWEENPVT